MEGFLRTLLSFPAVPFTVLLGIAFLYWVFVLLGVVAFDGDGALEGGVKAAGDALAGGVKAAGDAVTGGVKAAGEAISSPPTPAAALEAKAAAVDSKLNAGTGVLSMLGFGKVPSSISGSLLLFFCWVFTMFGSSWLGGEAALVAKVGVLFGSCVLSFFASSVAVRPLVKAFHSAPPQRRHHFIGKVCEITSGRVDATFGTATVRDGGAGLNLNIACSSANELKKGDSALIIDFNEETETWEIEPMDWLEPQERELLKNPETASQVISSRMRTRG